MPFPPIETIHLHAYRGPNIFGPQPGVLLRVRCDKDRSQRIKIALKDGAQYIGMIIAYLEVTAIAADEGVLVSAVFTTPTPQIGAAFAAYVVAGVRAQALGDESWDADGPLYELQKRRRQEALPVQALQLLAEARKRDVPILHLPDGQVQLGYGVRGWAFHPATASETAPPWARLGAIPIYAVTGEQQRDATVERVAAQLRAAGHSTRSLPDAGYVATMNLLANPCTETAVIGLASQDILQHGLAFDRCTQAIITDADGERPPAAGDNLEWVRALGVPMLVSSGPAIINQTDPRLAGLAGYAPHGVLPLNDE